MIDIEVTSTEAKSYDCSMFRYPYDENFVVNVEKGKNSLKFFDEATYNSFLAAAASDIMGGEIIIGELADEVEDTQETEIKSSKKSKKKAEND